MEKTQSLLRMYQLESPVKKETISKSRSATAYDLQKLRKQAVHSFTRRKSPQKFPKHKQAEAHRRYTSTGQTDMLRAPLTDRDLAMAESHSLEPLNLAQQRQQLIRSMVNGSKLSPRNPADHQQEMTQHNLKKL